MTLDANTIIEELEYILTNKQTYLQKWKEKNKHPIIGYLCSYTPVEIIQAAGCLPVRFLSKPENIQESDKHLPHFTCFFIRSIVDEVLKGSADYLDGIVGCRTCDTTRICFDVLKKNTSISYQYFLQAPSNLQGAGVEDFWQEEMNLFAKDFEKFIAKKISKTDLNNAIDLYNQNRALIRQIYDLSKGEAIFISGVERINILLAGLIMPVEEHNRYLEKLLVALRQRDAKAATGLRIMVIGAALDKSNLHVVREIEKAGGSVVIDSSCVGSRNIMDDVGGNGDPMKRIADRYLHRVPCPTKVPVNLLFDDILKLAKSYKINGVVFLTQKYCDPHEISFPDLRDEFKKSNIPTLKIELGEAMSSVGQISTRISAFYEVIKGI
ncbi:MAG: 2-hydroxyacyl-CoA dehydratase family protein [Desulfobacterales bacterium]|jgi:benzoyl-CoA reductase subunit C|nr:2-hydroxyacyl-CoA dehydratase family protein [Desulfobacterales bacterium]